MQRPLLLKVSHRENSVSAVFHLISNLTSGQMVNSENRWAQPIHLISFPTTFLLLAVPCSLSHLFNNCSLFFYFSSSYQCQTKEDRKVGSNSFTDMVVCCHFPTVSNKFLKNPQNYEDCSHWALGPNQTISRL